MSRTNIDWATRTWNIIEGCSHASEGCQNCYAERLANRMSCNPTFGADNPYKHIVAKGKFTGDVIVMHERIGEIARLTKAHRIFVASRSDLFHENLPFCQVAQIWNELVAAKNSRHSFLILTKRPARIHEFLRWLQDKCPDTLPEKTGKAPLLENLWIGATVENQRQAEKRIPELLKVPATSRWLSVEPLIGAIDLSPWLATGKIHWVIVGGESGSGARPCHPDWVRSLRDQCGYHGVAFFFKQWGEWEPARFIEIDGSQIPDCDKFLQMEKLGSLWMWKCGKRQSGHLLNGAEVREFPGGMVIDEE
jgi:protein gp37